MTGDDHDIVQAYVAAYPADVTRIHELRDNLRHQVHLNDTYAPSEAHITVFPLFSIGRDHLPVVRSAVRTLGLSGRPIRLAGLGVWPSFDNPRVILLNCDVNLGTERQQLKSLLQTCDSVSGLRTPTPPHITLLKTGSARNLSTQQKQSLQQFIAKNTQTSTWETTIKYVDVVVKDNG